MSLRTHRKCVWVFMCGICVSPMKVSNARRCSLSIQVCLCVPVVVCAGSALLRESGPRLCLRATAVVTHESKHSKTPLPGRTDARQGTDVGTPAGLGESKLSSVSF